MGFPSVVNTVQGLGVAGDFCDINPRATVDASGGAHVAGANGLTVGRFAWADSSNTTVSNTGSGVPTGFVHREQQALITAFLGDDTMIVPPGLPAVLHSAGGFLVKNDGTTTSAIGNKAYANNATGQVTFAATGNPPSAASISVGTLTANTLNVSAIAPNTLTGSISGTTLTVTAVGAGSVLASGLTLTATGLDTCTITGQLTGTAGSTGTYSVSVSQTFASAAITASGGGLTVTSMTNGKLFVGQVLSGGTNAVAAGTTIIALGTGTGGAGTYVVSISQTCASTATATGSGGYLTATTMTGTLYAGDTITSTNTPAGTYILPLGTGGTTGVGSTGTYIISSAAGAGDTAFTVAAGVETKWIATSVGAPGELVKMSSHLLG
jgi:hypothetical protein